jgi:hypothetical protein
MVRTMFRMDGKTPKMIDHNKDNGIFSFSLLSNKFGAEKARVQTSESATLLRDGTDRSVSIGMLHISHNEQRY